MLPASPSHWPLYGERNFGSNILAHTPRTPSFTQHVYKCMYVNEGDAEVGKTSEIALRLRKKHNIAVKKCPTFSQCSVDNLRPMIRGNRTFYAPTGSAASRTSHFPQLYLYLSLLAPLLLLPISPSAPMLSCSAAQWFSFNPYRSTSSSTHHCLESNKTPVLYIE